MPLATFRAGEPISVGDVLYVGPSGLVYKASSPYQNQASVAGVSLDVATTGNVQVRTITEGLYTAFSGLVPGDNYYLGILPSGQVVSYLDFSGQLSSSLVTNSYQVIVGRAVSSSGIYINPKKPTAVPNLSTLLLLESSPLLPVDVILLEDGSSFELETATL